MSETKPWTEEEDRLLKFVFQTTKVTKWSHIGKRLQYEFGVKGRNGKQCKQRYSTIIDPTYPKEEWSYEQEQKMFQLHNQLGNKWAIIGTKCGGKTDNSVKNHFYSRLRKALKKINQVIVDKLQKQYKQLKPPLLYKIVQVSEERFKINSTLQKEFVFFSNQLKNQLLNFSYDDEENQQTESIINVDMAKNLVQKVNEFGANYKKKTKKQRKSSEYQNNLLTPHRYQRKGRKFNSQNEESSQNNSLMNSSDMGNSQDISDDEIHHSRLNVNYDLIKLQRNSADNTSIQKIQVPKVRTRAKSNENIKKQAARSEDVQMKDQKYEENYRDQVEVLQALQGFKIFEEEQNFPPHPSMMNKEVSRYSRYSEGIIQKEEYHFFDDSQMEMHILPQVQGLKRDSQFDQNIFR